MFVCMFVCIKIPKKVSPNSPDQDLARSGQFGDRSFFMRKGGLVGFGKGGGGEVMRKTLKWHDLSSFKKIAIEQTSKTGYKFIYV